jgi:hypothetical protein
MTHEFDLMARDDSGPIVLVDAPSYTTSSLKTGSTNKLMGHFAIQMQRGSILVWDCADGGDDYRVRVGEGLNAQSGLREVTGQIISTGNRLHLSSYTALTMAAQFSEHGIPDKRGEGTATPVAPGAYSVRIVQMHDPNEIDDWNEQPHFLLEMEPGDAPMWSDVARRAA